VLLEKSVCPQLRVCECVCVSVCVRAHAGVYAWRLAKALSSAFCNALPLFMSALHGLHNTALSTSVATKRNPFTASNLQKQRFCRVQRVIFRTLLDLSLSKHQKDKRTMENQQELNCPSLYHISSVIHSNITILPKYICLGKTRKVR